MQHRINIVGAAGSGTSTLGKALSLRLGCQHFEADDFLWLSTNPPYQKMRSYEDKNKMAYESLISHDSFVISGSVSSWEPRVVDLLNCVVYLDVPTDVRLSRLIERETRRFGKIDKRFYEWAKQYDEGRLPGRSRIKHESWLSRLRCKVIKLVGDRGVYESLEYLTKQLT
jgi:adenylate kinase family enzyme